VVASAALWRAKVRVVRVQPGVVTAYLGAVLVLCKTLSALVYAAVLTPLVRWAKPGMQVRIAAILIFITLVYPMLRTVHLIPSTLISDAATSVSAERADSLKTRFVWEEQLLRRASERLWFGWGRFGRSRIYSESGEDITVSDGEWVIRMGTFGLFGFWAEFG